MDLRRARLGPGMRLFAATAVIIGGQLVSLADGGAPTIESAQAASCPEIIAPAYFADDGAWRTMTETSGLGIVVINPQSGPGARASAEWAQRVRDVRASGAIALGYVPTDLGTRKAKQVMADVRRYWNWYEVDGIYLDEVTGKARNLKYYRKLSQAIRRGPAGKRFVMMNPGWTPARGYMALTDVVENYEYFYTHYKKQVFPAWVKEYPANRFAHIVHDVPRTPGAMEWALQNARAHNAGYVFITDRNNPMEYKSLPSFWQETADQLCG